MKKVYLKAHKQSELKVGEIYSVAFVRVTNLEVTPNIDIEVPVIPIFHNDKEAFGLDAPHYHIDGRFVSNGSKVAKIWHVSEGYTSAIVTEKLGNQLSPLFFKNKKCLRVETGVVSGGSVGANWRKSMQGKSCKGKICPHWGAVMSNIDGVLVCPMHGLKGDIKKEIII